MSMGVSSLPTLVGVWDVVVNFKVHLSKKKKTVEV
jgi:hypothetical protein